MSVRSRLTQKIFQCENEYSDMAYIEVESSKHGSTEKVERCAKLDVFSASIEGGNMVHQKK